MEELRIDSLISHSNSIRDNMNFESNFSVNDMSNATSPASNKLSNLGLRDNVAFEQSESVSFTTHFVNQTSNSEVFESPPKNTIEKSNISNLSNLKLMNNVHFSSLENSKQNVGVNGSQSQSMDKNNGLLYKNNNHSHFSQLNDISSKSSSERIYNGSKGNIISYSKISQLDKLGSSSFSRANKDSVSKFGTSKPSYFDNASELVIDSDQLINVSKLSSKPQSKKPSSKNSVKNSIENKSDFPLKKRNVDLSKKRKKSVTNKSEKQNKNVAENNLQVHSIEDQPSLENSSAYDVYVGKPVDRRFSKNSQQSNASKSDKMDYINIHNAKSLKKKMLNNLGISTNERIVESRFEDQDRSQLCNITGNVVQNQIQEESYEIHTPRSFDLDEDDDIANLILSDEEDEQNLASFKMTTLGGEMGVETTKNALDIFL